MKAFKLTALAAMIAIAGCSDNDKSPLTDNEILTVSAKESKPTTVADIQAGMVIGTYNTSFNAFVSGPSKTLITLENGQVILNKKGADYIKYNKLTALDYTITVAYEDREVARSATATFDRSAIEALVPTAKTIFSDNFESMSLNQWETIDKGGSNHWLVEKSDSQVAVANCYQSEGGCDDWLVSPVLDISQLSKPLLSFSNAWSYGSNSLNQMKLYITTNYSGDPSSTQWTDITDKATWSKGSSEFLDSEVDLADYKAEKNVRIAFHYKTTVADAAKWSIDNVRVGGEAFILEQQLPKSSNLVGRELVYQANVKGSSGNNTYVWDFGDGSDKITTTEPTVRHTFFKEGSYPVRVDVTDENGAFLTQVSNVSVGTQTTYSVPAKKGVVRVASFNVGLDRFNSANAMNTELEKGTDAQAMHIAEIIQRTDADVLLINEIDGNDSQKTLNTFLEKYLKVGQNSQYGMTYQYQFMSDCNTGMPSNQDYNNNGKTTDPDDAYGFGRYPGQYCMAILSKLPIDTNKARTFQNFLWKDMPNALRPTNLDGSDWYTETEWDSFRLSSKTHIDLPVTIAGKTVHILASHPTPPVFDGKEDRNGKRNFDEIRLWADYINPASTYLYDDQGNTNVTLDKNTRFIIMGDQNASSVEGDATVSQEVTSIDQLLTSSFINMNLREGAQTAVIPMSTGGKENRATSDYSQYHTASWAMRADYVLPSSYGLAIEQSGVFWPKLTDDLYYLVNTTDEKGARSSDHRLVWMDLNLIESNVNLDNKTPE